MSGADWRAVARKDFEDAVRSRMVWSVMGVFVALLSFLLLAVDAAEFNGGGAEGAIAYVSQWGQLYVPLVTLIAAYLAVVGERRSGSLRVLLSYPFTRREVVAGKLLGRSVVTLLTLSAAFLVMGGLTVVLYGSLPVAKFLAVVGVVVLFGLSFTGIAVGISAATGSRETALALAIGSFLVFFVFWNGLASGLYYLVYGSLPGLEPAPWYFLAERLSPLEAYRVLLDGILDSFVEPLVGVGLEDLPADVTPEELRAVNRVSGDMPFYLRDWFTGLVLVAWAVVPPALGYWRFERSDLD